MAGGEIIRFEESFPHSEIREERSFHRYPVPIPSVALLRIFSCIKPVMLLDRVPLQVRLQPDALENRIGGDNGQYQNYAHYAGHQTGGQT